ncbi:ABC transporter substrate-binding protein [Candidatus Albibeggiatoa sp. nov. NOAA]|uniref:ABC transporter substrate-binding protein n=1 Tax=Candidatus Albibeggiatoa sp. nov. NOAA TaxID=3162724 RepID=UPI0032F0B8E2|nr:ABC transporter substrate-binding protein [Thiotrichaceae bacterium]
MMRVLYLTCIAIFLVNLTACERPAYKYKDEREEKAEKAHKRKAPINIGVVWDSRSQSLFFEGARFAAQELNARGGILGRRVNLIERDEAVYLQAGFFEFSKKMRNHAQFAARTVAEELAKNTDVVAVVGHTISETSIAASITYEYFGLLYLGPGATNIELTRHNFMYTFRLIPDNYQESKQLAGYIYYSLEKKKIVVLYDRTEYSTQVAESFAETIADMQLDADIVYRRSFFKTKKSFKDIMSDLKGLEFDVVFVATNEETGSRILKEARNMGIKHPVVGVNLMYHPRLIELAGDTAEGFSVPAPFNESFNLARGFINRFRKQYDVKPDAWAAQAYDSIMLLAYIIEKSDSTVPIVLSTQLRYMEPYWLGVTGPHAFTKDGEISGKQYSFYTVHQGKFELIPGANVPFILELIKFNENKSALLELEEQDTKGN